MSSNIQNLIDSGTTVILQVSANELKSFLRDVLSQNNNPAKEENSEKETYLTPSKVSQLLHVDKSTLWRWSKSGYLKPIEIGGKRLYKESEINKIMGGGR